MILQMVDELQTRRHGHSRIMPDQEHEAGKVNELVRSNLNSTKPQVQNELRLGNFFNQ
jgi:hypothetical protein